MTGSKYKQTIPSSPAPQHTQTHNTRDVLLQNVLTLTGLVSSRRHQGWPEHSRSRCWNQPAPQKETDGKLLAQRSGLVIYWAPCSVLLHSNYRHPNNRLSSGAGKSSLSPGTRHGAGGESEAWKNKMMTPRSQSWLFTEVGLQSLLHYTQFNIQQLTLE